jgi:hypothetical protein
MVFLVSAVQVQDQVQVQVALTRRNQHASLHRETCKARKELSGDSVRPVA